MKTTLIPTAAIAWSIVLVAVVAADTGCNKTSDLPLTNIPSERRDISQAVVLTETRYDEDIVLSDRVNGVDYLIENNVQMNANLTLEPGVTLMFRDGAGIQVNEGGSLSAIGQPGNLIYFIGESNKRGSWKGITILSHHARNVLTYCHIEQGGGNNCFDRADVIVGSGDRIGQTEISFSEITTSQTCGILVAAGSQLTNFHYNLINVNTQAPIEMYVGNTAQLDNTNTYSGNGLEYIRLKGSTDGAIKDSVSLKKLDQPYLLSGYYRSAAAFIVQPGTRLYMDDNTQIVVDGTTGKAWFSAKGTLAQPISILPLYPGQGRWSSISFIASHSAQNVFEYCVISGGGAAGNVNPGAGMLNVMTDGTDSSQIVLRNSTVTNSGSYGIYIQTSHCAYNSDILSANQFYNNEAGNIRFE